MTYIAQLAGMALGGIFLGLTIHYVLIDLLFELEDHYLEHMVNYLERFFPNAYVVMLISTLIVGFVTMIIGAALYDDGKPVYILFFAIGFGMYSIVVPLWKTWFPFLFGRMFPRRMTK